jgi:NADPH:quinone reductase-like Zn-dependent oxidoreductase
MSQETILVTGAAGSVGSTAHTAIAMLPEQGTRSSRTRHGAQAGRPGRHAA